MWLEPDRNEVAILVACALGVALALAYGWYRAVAWLYRLRSRRPERLTARAADGWELAVYRRASPDRRFEEPVLLCHGLAANHYYFDFDPPHSVADFLAAAGFDCFSVEWRGTGASRRPPPGRRATDFTIDDHIRYDGPAVVKLAMERTGARGAFWLGHSLGGLIGYGVAGGEAGAHLKGLLALGSPVFFRYQGFLRTVVNWGSVAAWPFGIRHRLLASGVAPFLGWVALPYTDVVINPRNMAGRLQRQVILHVLTSIARRTLVQLRDWALHDAFRSLDHRVDYREGIRTMQTPLLVMAGSADRLATSDSAQKQHQLAGSPDKTLVIFGRENGDRDDYGHGDLVFGVRAPEEVYPVVLRWLTQRATPWAPPPAPPGAP